MRGISDIGFRRILAYIDSQLYPAQDMEDFFLKRTALHCDLVQKYCEIIYSYDPERFSGLLQRGEVHDSSKYHEPERDAYVWTTWQYKCKDEGVKCSLPEGMKERMTEATEHHVKSNAHHPEFHDKENVKTINREDRDKPPENKVNATKMKDLDLAEMVADWAAMSEEKGTSLWEWAEKNVNIRWEFTDDQVDLIYGLIGMIEDDLEIV